MGLISRALTPPPAVPAVALDTRTSEGLDAWLRTGDRTWSGEEISETTALKVSAFFAGIRYVSEDTGKLPWPVFRRGPNDDRERATDSPYWDLLHDEPNGWMDSFQFRELGTAIALLRGDFVAIKSIATRPGLRWPGVQRGDVIELLPVKPAHVTIEQREDYSIEYRVQMASGEPKVFNAREMFHLRGFSLDGVHGLSILAQARQALGLTVAIQKRGASVFKNGANPGGVYKHPGALSDRAFERLKEDIDDLKGEGAGGALILEEGMDWAQVGMTNEDAEYLGSLQFQIAEFCRFIRIAPHKLFELTRSTNNNIEHQSIEYVQDTLLTWGTRWDSAARRQVIPRASGLYAETNYDALLRPTTKDRNESFRVASGRPWMTGNEVRRANNLPRIDDDPSMDTVVLPKNLGNEGGDARREQQVDDPEASNAA